MVCGLLVSCLATREDAAVRGGTSGIGTRGGNGTGTDAGTGSGTGGGAVLVVVLVGGGRSS